MSGEGIGPGVSTNQKWVQYAHIPVGLTKKGFKNLNDSIGKGMSICGQP